MESSKRAQFLNSQFLIVSALFLLSGMSSLVYQVIWTRLLVFVFGSTTFATSTVLSVFMGGLALGSYLAGKKADQVQRPLFWYGVLELIIGVWALITPLLFSMAIPLYKLSFDAFHLQIILFGVFRYFIASIILLLPTACMGATLPLLARYVTESLDQVGDRVGTLYAINTLGAVIGSISAGFFLIPGFGLNITTLIAATINFLLMGAVLVVSKLPGFSARNRDLTLMHTTPDTAVQSETTTVKLPAVVKATMLSFGISGGLAMIYEVAWTRALLMVIGSTTYAFTVMLSAFLIGIFAGSLLCARFVDRLKSPDSGLLGFAVVQICLCLFGILSLATFNQLPYLNLVIGNEFRDNPEVTIAFRFIASQIVLLPISLCLGATFPLAVKVCANDLQKIGKSLGELYSVNTVGAILGAFIAGFFVIPLLGSEMTLLATSLANLVLGVVLLLWFVELSFSVKAITAAISLGVVLFTWMKPPQFWDYNVIVVAQLIRRHMLALKQISPWEALDLFNKQETSGEILFYKEGKTANVAVRKLSANGSITLVTNGHIDASNNSDMQNQAMLGILPLLFRNSAGDDVCVVGWGSGVTNGYALRFPIKSMICAELEPVVLETSKYFHDVNFKAEQDKRTVIEPADGRNFLLGTKQKFDVIMSEPSNPWQSGVCNLFTREYFQICKESLKPAGVFTLWTQVNEIPTEDLAGVFRSLHDVYPCIYILDTGDGGDLNALAFPVETKISYEQVKKNIELPGLKDVISRFRVGSADDFIAHIVAGPDSVAKAVEGFDANTDDRNLLEYDVAKTYENKQFNAANREWLRSTHGPVWDHIDWGNMSPEEKAQTFTSIGRSCVRCTAFAKNARAIDWAEESIKIFPNVPAFSLIIDLYIAEKDYARAQQIIDQGRRSFPLNKHFDAQEGLIALRKGDYSKAKQFLAKACAADKNDLDAAYDYSLCFTDINLGQVDQFFVPPPEFDAKKVIELCMSPAASDSFVRARPAVLAVLASAFMRVGDYDDAEKTLRRLVQIAPGGYLSWQLLGQVYDCKNRPHEAAMAWYKSAAIIAREYPSLLDKTNKLLLQNKDSEALGLVQEMIQMSPHLKEPRFLLQALASRNSDAAKFQSRLLAQEGQISH